METPRSDEALLKFDEYCRAIRHRLDAGKRVYGDSSFDRPLISLIEEIRQEVLDQAGWAFIAYSKLAELEEQMYRLNMLISAVKGQRL